MDQKFEVNYRDRQTGEMVTEVLLYEPFQSWVYRYSVLFKIFNRVLNTSVFCRLYGKFQSLSWSRRKVYDFVARHGIDFEEIEFPLHHYRSFNAFFTRRLKSEARPFASEPDVFCAPAEGKVLVYPHLDEGLRIPVKGDSMTLASLLACESTADFYRGGSALIVRLAPYDYHRFHFSDAGEAGPARSISGRYYVVNPAALARMPDVLNRNKRSVTEFVSARFGQIAYIEIGGFAVASIVQTCTPGRVGRGQEKGYFQYGGSTLVLLFEPGAITFDEDLIQGSAEGVEVHVRVGSGIGRRT